MRGGKNLAPAGPKTKLCKSSCGAASCGWENRNRNEVEAHAGRLRSGSLTVPAVVTDARADPYAVGSSLALGAVSRRLKASEKPGWLGQFGRNAPTRSPRKTTCRGRVPRPAKRAARYSRPFRLAEPIGFGATVRKRPNPRCMLVIVRRLVSSATARLRVLYRQGLRSPMSCASMIEPSGRSCCVL